VCSSDLKNWPRLAAFHGRISAILSQTPPIQEDGTLSPALLTFSSEAKAAWVAFHDAVEAELKEGGALCDVRDVASKAADNAARLSALFHFFEHGVSAIGVDCFKSASRIVAWHLSESRRFFREFTLPAELADAARLDDWLLEYCQRECTHLVPVSAIQKSGPGSLRSKERMEIAVRELEELNRAQMVRGIGKAKNIKVNPALLGFAVAVFAVIAVFLPLSPPITAKTAITAAATFWGVS
jgi:putative DNA primase/helicase